jgi:hypothetical protein
LSIKGGLLSIDRGLLSINCGLLSINDALPRINRGLLKTNADVRTTTVEVLPPPFETPKPSSKVSPSVIERWAILEASASAARPSSIRHGNGPTTHPNQRQTEPDRESLSWCRILIPDQ